MKSLLINSIHNPSLFYFYWRNREDISYECFYAEALPRICQWEKCWKIVEKFFENHFGIESRLCESQLKTLLPCDVWCVFVWLLSVIFFFYIYIYAFSRRFYPKRLTLHSSYSFTFYQLLLSLGIEPTILALLVPCSTIWATGKLFAVNWYSVHVSLGYVI